LKSQQCVQWENLHLGLFLSPQGMFDVVRNEGVCKTLLDTEKHWHCTTHRSGWLPSSLYPSFQRRRNPGAAKAGLSEDEIIFSAGWSPWNRSVWDL